MWELKEGIKKAGEGAQITKSIIWIRKEGFSFLRGGIMIRDTERHSARLSPLFMHRLVVVVTVDSQNTTIYLLTIFRLQHSFFLFFLSLQV